MNAPTFQQRKLARAAQELSELLRDLRHRLQWCPQCGAYHSEELAATEDGKRLHEMVEQLVRWQSAPWAREDVDEEAG